MSFFLAPSVSSLAGLGPQKKLLAHVAKKLLAHVVKKMLAHVAKKLLTGGELSSYVAHSAAQGVKSSLDQVGAA